MKRFFQLVWHFFGGLCFFLIMAIVMAWSYKHIPILMLGVLLLATAYLLKQETALKDKR